MRRRIGYARPWRDGRVDTSAPIAAPAPTLGADFSRFVSVVCSVLSVGAWLEQSSQIGKNVKRAASFQRIGCSKFYYKKVETITNVTYILSKQVAEMFELFAKIYRKPIVITLDNASYQTCKYIREAAKQLDIELAYLPTYSPNLNLIERVWMLLKSKVLSLQYHETFNKFCESITKCMESLHTSLLPNIKPRIANKFHILDDNVFA